MCWGPAVRWEAQLRNSITRLRDTQVVDLDELELDYSRLEDAQTCLIELVTPSVVASEYPGSDGRAALNSGL
jgi:hypothetical protein